MNYDEALREAREREGKREISDQAARALCAAWQSSGTVGSKIAAAATGAWTAPMPKDRLDAFHDDLHATFISSINTFTEQLSSDDQLVWGMLATWAANGPDLDADPKPGRFRVIYVNPNGDRELHGTYHTWQQAHEEQVDRKLFHTDTDGSKWLVVDHMGREWS